MRFPERVEEWIGKRKRPILLGVCGLILVGVGVAWWRMALSVPQTEVEVLSATTDQAPAGELMIDVGGAVASPGVYALPVGARVVEVLNVAGGLTNEADTDWVDKYLNRSEKVRDGQKVYIPKKSVGVEPLQETDRRALININTAGQSELETLSGVGPVTALKIIAGRPYGRIEELKEKKIVGASVWDKISALIAVW